MEGPPTIEKKETNRPSSIRTAKGSTYRYLPDGRTQRFKEATGELMEPMDILVFIPPWDWVKDEAQKRYPKYFAGIENELQYEQDLLEYAQLPNKTIVVSDEKGTRITSLAEMKAAKHVVLHFITKDGDDEKSTDFSLPVAKAPKMGWYTYDDSRWVGKDGLNWHAKHMGNKVVEIQYER